ncbi:MAG: hypothetical protein KBD52_00315 [Candidatus Pacebacteria bacterium]|nr:hypothetical protein [Candidatus Paceibacterota bacterium]
MIQENYKNMFKGKYIKIGVFVLLLVFFTSYITYQIRLPAAEDLPRLIKNGEMIMAGDFDVITKNVYSATAPDHPFANHHWLSAVFFYGLYKIVGFTGIVILKILFFLFTFSLLFYLATRKANFWLVALFSIPTLIILIGRSAARPEMFSYFFIVLYLYIFYLFEKNPNTKKIFWLIPLQLLWTNMHLFFGVGILLIGGFLFERFVLNFKHLRKDKNTLKLGIVFIFMVLTIFLTPYGIGGAIHSLRVNTSSDFPISSSETQSIKEINNKIPPIDNIPITIFPTLAILLGISFLIRYRRGLSFKNLALFYLMASIGTVFVALNVIRSLPMFAIIFLLAVSSNLDGFFVEIKEKFEKKFPEIKKVFYIILVLVFVFILIYITFFARKIISPYGELGVGLAPRSHDMGNFFKDNKLKGPIFNDTDIGSYLIYHLYPEEKVFVDNRFGDAYPATFFKNVYQPMAKDEEEWKRLSEIYQINTVIFYQYDAGSGARDFLFRRIYDPLWAWVYADDNAVILVKNIPENKEVIEKFQITKENIRERLSFLELSPRLDDKLGAADLYSLVGFTDFANEIYLKIVSEYPERGKIWMILGTIELTKIDQENSNPSLALVYIQRAIKEGWKTAEAYSYLALAYYRLENIEKAKEAVAKELKIDKDSEDAKEWIRTFEEEKLKDNL